MVERSEQPTSCSRIHGIVEGMRSVFSVCLHIVAILGTDAHRAATIVDLRDVIEVVDVGLDD